MKMRKNKPKEFEAQYQLIVIKMKVILKERLVKSQH
jgi:hypothetical protein